MNMGGTAASLTLIGLGLSGMVAATETGPGKPRQCTVGSHSVDIAVSRVLNIPQPCYEIRYLDQKTYICVASGGTAERPYGLATGTFKPGDVTEEGWSGGGQVGHTAEGALEEACRFMVQRHEWEEGRRRLDQETAAKALEEFFERGPSQ